MEGVFGWLRSQGLCSTQRTVNSSNIIPSFTTHKHTQYIYNNNTHHTQYVYIVDNIVSLIIPFLLFHMYKTTFLLVSFTWGNNTKVVVDAELGDYNSTLQLVIGSSSHRFHSLSSSLFPPYTIHHHLMRLLVLLVSITCLLSLVLAGPGTHRYEQPGHSNYGDDKTNQQ